MSQRLERAARRARRRPGANNPMSRSRPDRVAAWAFVLGIFLILLAATTSARRQRRRAGAPAAGAPAPVAGAPPRPSSASASCSEGSTGPDVRTLQAILQARDYGALKATGIFDEPTDGRGEALPARGRASASTASSGPQTRPRAAWR